MSLNYRFAAFAVSFAVVLSMQAADNFASEPDSAPVEFAQGAAVSRLRSMVCRWPCIATRMRKSLDHSLRMYVPLSALSSKATIRKSERCAH